MERKKDNREKRRWAWEEGEEGREVERVKEAEKEKPRGRWQEVDGKVREEEKGREIDSKERMKE